MRDRGPLVLLLLLLLATPSRAQITSSSDAAAEQLFKRSHARYVSRVESAQLAPDAALPILVQGRVMDKERDVPLVYTNVFIQGTGIGTMSISDGRFWIRGLRPGTYTIKARYISYEEGEVTISVRPGDIVELNFWLEIDPVRFDPYQVRAQRRLLVMEETGTARRLGADEIGQLPVDGLVEMVALQPGVSLEDNEIHIRGGRGDDTHFVVDGIGVKDPLAAGRYGVGFNEDLVNEIEVLTGGFSAEYGQAVSGVVNVSTKEGGEEFEGKITYKTDGVAPEANDYHTDDLRVTLSGPNPLWKGLKAGGLKLPGEQYLIASGSFDLSDTYLPTESLRGDLRSAMFDDSSLSPRAQNEWNGLAKLSWKLDPTRKLNLTYSNQTEISLGYFLPSEGFPRKYQNVLSDYNVFTTQNILSQLNWRHVLGDETFYEINLGRQFSRLHSNKNGEDDFTTYTGPITSDFSVGEGTSETLGAFLPGSDSDKWHDHYTETWTIKADYSWIQNEANQFKTGVEYNLSELQLVDLQGELGNAPPGYLARSQDVFRVHPRVGAAYVQDRVTYKGMVLNLGTRLDFWAPGREVDDVMSRPEDFVFIFDSMAKDYEDKTYDVFGLKWKARLSPRVGVSFPVSNKDKFFFNYGHFSQWPRYNYVYAQLQTDFATDLQLLGNPDLDPKVTVQYETGIQHEFDNLWSAGVTFYSNDIYGYAQSVSLPQITIDPVDTPDPDDQVAVTVEPVRYFNADAARSLGVEFSLQKRTTRWLSGSLSLEFQRSTGTNSDANATYISAQLGQGNVDYQTEQGIRSVPLLWDRPWSFTLNLDFRVGHRDRPRLMGWTLPAQWSANLLYRAWAGVRYTERELRADGNAYDSRDTYGRLGPYRSTFDLKLDKYWSLNRRQRLTVFLEARNIFDHDNYRRVNPWTGQGYYRGNWDGNIAAARNNGSIQSVDTIYYVEDYVDPSYRTNPRTVMMGVSVQW